VSEESVRHWLAEHAPDIALIDQGVSTATVAEAAIALGVESGRIAKTLAFRVGDRPMLLVTCGDARLDNGKCKAGLGGRPRMLDADDTLEMTGHAVGGVCPFGLANPVPIVCDRSLLDFATVFPAAGSRTSSIEIAPQRLAELVGGTWVDICKLPD
jgi:prolyl-tRNA editing enzyme YbaK/EbsC (Cys-tRNA(Pro) deacylase)